jgi:hypothetical protein
LWRPSSIFEVCKGRVVNSSTNALDFCGGVDIKELEVDAISLDNIDILSKWRVEV